MASGFAKALVAAAVLLLLGAGLCALALSGGGTDSAITYGIPGLLVLLLAALVALGTWVAAAIRSFRDPALAPRVALFGVALASAGIGASWARSVGYLPGASGTIGIALGAAGIILALGFVALALRPSSAAGSPPSWTRAVALTTVALLGIASLLSAGSASLSRAGSAVARSPALGAIEAALFFTGFAGVLVIGTLVAMRDVGAPITRGVGVTAGAIGVAAFLGLVPVFMGGAPLLLIAVAPALVAGAMFLTMREIA